MTNTFTKNWRLIFLVLAAILVLTVLYALRTVLLPFVVGLVLAYLLVPIVSWLERNLPRKGRWLGFKRISTIIVIFILLVGLVGGFAYFLITAVVDASVILLESTPDIISRSLFQVREWLEGLRQQLPIEIRADFDRTLIEGGAALGNSIRDALLSGISTAPSTFTSAFGFAALPFFLFYIIKDSEKLKNSIASALTPAVARHARNVASIVERVLGRYIRAQLMLGLIVGYFSFVGLLLLKVPFAPVLAILAGVTEFIPTVGPWIGGGVAVIVTLAVAPDKVLWVALLFLVVQLVENNFLVPRIQSAFLRIHPAVLIFLLVVGAYIAGFWGLLLAAPLTATAVEIFKYVRQEYQVAEVNRPIEPT
ncbi:AI-2E family transporter [Chloroflexota bacterium]